MTAPNFEKLAIDAIEATAATQVRVRIDKGMIDQYTEDFQNGAAFPPLDVFREPNSERVILADGFHRHRAAINAGRTDIGCHVHEGGMHDALMYALGSNAEHGFRRTNADKRHAVEMALKDPSLSVLRTQEIADICRVAKRTVEKIINEHLSADENDSQDANGSQNTPVDPKPDDFRESSTIPTQGDVDLEEARTGLKLLKGLPYDGELAVEKLDLTKDDIADLEYVSTWCAAAVIAYRNGAADE